MDARLSLVLDRDAQVYVTESRRDKCDINIIAKEESHGIAFTRSQSPMFTRAPCGLTFSHPVTRAFRPTCTQPRSLCKPLYSSAIRLKNDSVQNKLYAKSLLLPQTTFPQWTDPLKTEVLLRRKICDDLYRWQVRSQCRVYGPSHACTADFGS